MDHRLEKPLAGSFSRCHTAPHLVSDDGSIFGNFELPWVMGTKTMEEALERVKQWILADVLPQLKQPFLILHGENDLAIPVDDARKAFAAAGSSDKQLRIFTAAQGGAEHVQADQPDQARQLIADWFAARLS